MIYFCRLQILLLICVGLQIRRNGGEDLITLSPRGRISVGADNKVSFTADPDGNFRYQMPGDEAWAQRMLNLIRASNR
jgi:hypothetical protein